MEGKEAFGAIFSSISAFPNFLTWLKDEYVLYMGTQNAPYGRFWSILDSLRPG